MRPSFVPFAATVAFALACGGETVVDPASLAVPLVAPWDGYGLPLDGGNVMNAEPTMATMTYANTTVEALDPKFDAALEGHGWVESNRFPDAGMLMVTYTQGRETLTLSMVQATDTASVTLVLTPSP
jgi:hypothetical protein